MAEEFVNKANAAAFLSAYNKIDAQLRALYNFGSGQSFTDIVRRCAEKTPSCAAMKTSLPNMRACATRSCIRARTGASLPFPATK